MALVMQELYDPVGSRLEHGSYMGGRYLLGRMLRVVFVDVMTLDSLFQSC